jgi:hypothetical protein
MESVSEFIASSGGEAHPAIAHFRTLFESADRICLTFINRATSKANNDFLSVETACTPEYIEQLQARNNAGCDIYVAMNPVFSDANHRRKELVGVPRNVFLDVDVAGEEVLALVNASITRGETPEPSVILCSSPGKYQFVWHIDPDVFTADRIEAVNEALVQHFSGDPACTDILRVLRVPGYCNHKYPDHPIVQVVSSTPGRLCAYSDFKIAIEEAKESVVRPVARDDELSGIVNYFEEAATEAHLAISRLKKWGNNGFLWELTCPFVSEHTGQLDSGSVVILHNSGALDYVCRHGHCRERNWTKDFRPYLQTLVGHSLRFGDDPSGKLILNPPNDIVIPFKHSLTEQELELDKEYPVIPLAEQAGPQWEDDMLYGPAGAVIRKACEFSEAHPAGMMLDLLVSLGNAFGRSAYFNVGATQHFTNEFVARVGDSSDTRKGTGRDAIDEFIKYIDPTWFSNGVKSGFGSAEVITYLIRDGFVQSIFDKKKRIYTEVVVPGIEDKRLYVREGELASLFLMASKKDSRASVTLRDGFDGKKLSNLVKGSVDGINNSVSSCGLRGV